jgi:hypothetical protein
LASEVTHDMLRFVVVAVESIAACGKSRSLIEKR